MTTCCGWLLLLEVAADEQVEKLVGAAELDIGADLDGVSALDDRLPFPSQPPFPRPTVRLGQA